MNRMFIRFLVTLALPLALTFVAGAQTPQQSGTFVITGLTGQATVVRIRGKSYVDIDSLAQMMHGTLRTQGGQTILVMPQSASAAAATPTGAVKVPLLSVGYLGAEIEALTAIREWHVALVNAVQSNAPVAEDWTGRLRRGADTKVQLAVAAASNESDRKALDLLKNQFTNMQQINDHCFKICGFNVGFRPDAA